MRTGDIAERVDHGEDDQPKRKRNSDVGDRAARGLINNDGPGAGEEGFCQEGPRQCQPARDFARKE